MSQLKVGSSVRVAYDFAGEEANEELTVHEGEMLTIRFVDVGEGWLQCENSVGKSGLVPEAYVELSTTAVPAAPVPTPTTPTTVSGFNDDDWGNVFGSTPVTQNQPAFAPSPGRINCT